jgi:hypothetical protein
MNGRQVTVDKQFDMERRMNKDAVEEQTVTGASGSWRLARRSLANGKAKVHRIGPFGPRAVRRVRQTFFILILI